MFENELTSVSNPSEHDWCRTVQHHSFPSHKGMAQGSGTTDKLG